MEFRHRKSNGYPAKGGLEKRMIPKESFVGADTSFTVKEHTVLHGNALDFEPNG
jgi:hypothetical protein